MALGVMGFRSAGASFFQDSWAAGGENAQGCTLGWDQPPLAGLTRFATVNPGFRATRSILGYYQSPLAGLF
jgi:hypothetical protein